MTSNENSFDILDERKLAMQDYAKTLDILAWSHDPQLAATRGLLLQKAGYKFKSVETEETFQSALTQLHPKLVLLCQTLEAAECQRCDSFAKERDPHVRVVVMFNQRCKCVPSSNGMLVRSGAGPIFLLETISTLIGRTQAASQVWPMGGSPAQME